MNPDILVSALLPLMLAFIMIVLGLGLTSGDFLRIVQRPRAFVLGGLCHFVLLPLVCWFLIGLFGIKGPAAVGFMLIAACPTGTTSNLLTRLARGDVALALSFTAVASVVTMLTMPLILGFAFDRYLGSEQHISFPFGYLIGQIVLLLGLPVLLGMAIRRARPVLAMRVEATGTKIGTLFFLIIVTASLARNWSDFVHRFAELAPMAIALNVAMLLIGLAVGWLGRLDRRQSVTVGIEAAMQNASLAIVVAGSVLRRPELALPGAIYGVLMYAGGLCFAMAAGRVLQRQPDAQLAFDEGILRD